MAGDDHKADTKGDITNYIEGKVRNLLEYDMNEYQDPAWVQAAELFNEIVVPCDIDEHPRESHDSICRAPLRVRQEGKGMKYPVYIGHAIYKEDLFILHLSPGRDSTACWISPRLSQNIHTRNRGTF